MARETARRAGFVWALTKVDKLDPRYLLDGQAEAMVLPLGWLSSHPQIDKLKVALVFSDDLDLPCVIGRPTLTDKGLSLTADPPVSFYLPANVPTDIRQKLSGALNESLNANEELIRSLCLEKIETDFDEVSAFMNDQYRLQENIFNQLGFASAP